MSNGASPQAALGAFLKAFWPKAQRVDAKEKWRICIGAFLGIFIAGLGANYLSHNLMGGGGR